MDDIQIDGTPIAAAIPVRLARSRRRVTGKQVPNGRAEGFVYMGGAGQFGTIAGK
ncbi:hypothetical protein [Bradyrhizobium jicamae]|uniref:hypothetical protein n=1 Tax=Bradyrhizobium jicamae TaxID=280332 RepID=UPI0020132239|nr:hypothetical protein [Bradyrhizobium jicamae]